MDELVLFNNTVYGPLCPLHPIFETYSSAPEDFWGVTMYHATDLPEHIQSYFLVFKKSVLRSATFWGFWKQLSMDVTDHAYVVACYEICLTTMLRQAGFHCSAVRVMEGDALYDEPLKSYEMGIPVLKKKIFRVSGLRIPSEDYETLVRRLESDHSGIASAVHDYMQRHHFTWSAVPPPDTGGHKSDLYDYLERSCFLGRCGFQEGYPYSRSV